MAPLLVLLFFPSGHITGIDIFIFKRITSHGSIQTNPEMMKYSTSNKLWWTYEGLLEENPDRELLDAIDLSDIKN